MSGCADISNLKRPVVLPTTDYVNVTSNDDAECKRNSRFSFSSLPTTQSSITHLCPDDRGATCPSGNQLLTTIYNISTQQTQLLEQFVCICTVVNACNKHVFCERSCHLNYICNIISLSFGHPLTLNTHNLAKIWQQQIKLNIYNPVFIFLLS